MNVIEYLKDNIVYLDGGMGTLLQAEGLQPGEYPEMWNITHPDVVKKIHLDYFNAGSNIVNTNTFGANILKFTRDELEDIISAAISNAKTALEKSPCAQKKFISLDIGPLGKLLKPFGDLDFEDAVSVFAETVKTGVKYGVDLITIETMNDSYETKAALLAARENSDLPVFVTNAYGEDGKLTTGASPEAMVALLEGMGADAIGLNCSLGPKQMKGIAEKLISFASVPVILKPNAGLPRIVEGKTVFDVLPEEFSDDIAEMVKGGVRVVGGCCGTTPEYIKKVVEKTRDISPAPVTEKNITCVSSYTNAVIFGDSPILIGERINPTGKKRFKQALAENDIGYILEEGQKQEERGVHILDVNVGSPDIDEVSMLKNVVYELQAVTSLPLQIDTSDYAAMENAMRIYNGKPMVNSVSGKEECMHKIFPLIKKYGGLVVALTLDDSGIPQTAEERYAIAEKIVKVASEYGIQKKDIIIDPLAMTISTDPMSALATLKSIKLITEKLGCNTSLGVSNVSFGLPMRDSINSTFFATALETGLSAAIMNPYSADMLKVYYSFKALHGLDRNCSEYLAFAETCDLTASVSSVVKKTSAQHSDVTLYGAITKGRRDLSSELTKKLLLDNKPLDIVNSHIIPALDSVGVGFENKKIYLPQLLMSAEAAQFAFEEIKKYMRENKSDEQKKCTIVLATVKGDIHDIGKNIVKLLLENYGFDVHDLGKDVPPENILAEVVKHHAPIAALSALMTTTVPAMEDTINILKENAPWCKTVVGGAVLNQECADRIGADKYAKDALETVRFAETVNSEIK
ncbi:MAG: homocysteine methyltransferase [Ruminococcaceae bacterium]|nr:homocysteine methyltransferase [Oscillospiraceae bacterium]